MRTSFLLLTVTCLLQLTGCGPRTGTENITNTTEQREATKEEADAYDRAAASGS